MKVLEVVIYSTPDTIDPNETCENPRAFLTSFVDLVTIQIERIYPESKVVLIEEAYTNSKGDDFQVFGDLSWDEKEFVEDDIREILEKTFEACCIGFESRGKKREETR